MAITQTSVSAATPQFWFAIAIGALRGNTVLANLVRRDIKNEIAAKGKTVNVTKRGALTVQDKTANNNITPQSPANTSVPVTLSNHKVVPWELEDAAGSVAIDDAVNYVEDAMIALAEEIEGDLAGLYTEIAQSVGTAGVDITEATVLAARKQLNDLKCRQTGRALMVSTKDEVALLGLDKFTRADARGDGGTALEEARLGRLYGFDVYMSQFVKETNPGTQTTHNMAFTKDAFALVSRPLALPPEKSGAESMVMIDPVTGIAVRLTKQWNILSLSTTWAIDILYGVAALDEDRCAVEVLA